MTYDLATVLPEPVKPKRPRWIVPVLAALAVLLLGAGVAIYMLATRQPAPAAAPTTPPPAPVPTLARTSFSVEGLLFLYDDDAGFKEDRDCAGDGGYSDIHTGTQVTITGPAGEVLALTKLAGGTGAKVAGKVVCGWLFSASNVPLGMGFYGVEVAHRGVVRYSESDMQELLDLSLGD